MSNYTNGNKLQYIISNGLSSKLYWMGSYTLVIAL